MGMGWYLISSRRLTTICSSSLGSFVRWDRAHLSPASIQVEKIPEYNSSETVHSSKSLGGICQYYSEGIERGGGKTGVSNIRKGMIIFMYVLNAIQYHFINPVREHGCNRPA